MKYVLLLSVIIAAWQVSLTSCEQPHKPMIDHVAAHDDSLLQAASGASGTMVDVSQFSYLDTESCKACTEKFLSDMNEATGRLKGCKDQAVEEEEEALCAEENANATSQIVQEFNTCIQEATASQ